MALRKGLVELVYGPVLRQSVSGVTEPLLSSVLVVSRIPDVSLGHDGLCFDDAKIVFFVEQGIRRAVCLHTR